MLDNGEGMSKLSMIINVINVVGSEVPIREPLLKLMKNMLVIEKIYNKMSARDFSPRPAFLEYQA